MLFQIEKCGLTFMIFVSVISVKRLLALQCHIKSEAMCASHLGAARVPKVAEIRDTFSVTGRKDCDCAEVHLTTLVVPLHISS